MKWGFFQSQIEAKSKRDPPWPTPFTPFAAPGHGVVKVEVAGHMGTKVLGHMVRHVGLSPGDFLNSGHGFLFATYWHHIGISDQSKMSQGYPLVN